LDEISFHDSPYDCWVTIYDRVYDITSFLQEVRVYTYIVLRLSV